MIASEITGLRIVGIAAAVPTKRVDARAYDPLFGAEVVDNPWDADIVMGHRPYDYHADHRYTGVLLNDAAVVVAAPFFTPDTAPTRGNAGCIRFRTASSARTHAAARRPAGCARSNPSAGA